MTDEYQQRQPNQRGTHMRTILKSLAVTLTAAGIMSTAMQLAPAAQAAPLNGPPAGSRCLWNDDGFGVGGSRSTDTGVVLELQPDHNLVLSANNRALWANGIHSTAYWITMQEDGNLVEYDRNFKPLWATNTSGNEGAQLCIQTDGNLVIYGGGWYPIWATNTRA
jgi:hypothetical protein